MQQKYMKISDLHWYFQMQSFSLSASHTPVYQSESTKDNCVYFQLAKYLSARWISNNEFSCEPVCRVHLSHLLTSVATPSSDSAFSVYWTLAGHTLNTAYQIMKRMRRENRNRCTTYTRVWLSQNTRIK